MLFIVSLILAALFAFLCKKAIKKYPTIFYIAAAVISVAVTFIDLRSLPTAAQSIVELFSRGVFATALWCVIMWLGALPNGSAPMKALMPIRGELSIFAAILTLGHNIGFGKTYFVRMFTTPESMKPTPLAAGTLSLIMLIIMLPLTILSIKSLRKKLSAKLWKRIQRAAYLFYAMIYVHVIILFLPSAKLGRLEYQISVVAYSIVFITYAVCRVYKAVTKKKTANKTASKIVCLAAAVCAMLIVVLLMQPEKTTDIDATPSDTTTEAIEDIVSDEGTDESDEVDTSAAKNDKLYNDGSYTASAFGYDGDITVTVTIAEDKITSISASSEEEDLWYFEQAKSKIIDLIISSRSTEVDAVSGATYSSKGIMKAVENALAKAKADA